MASPIIEDAKPCPWCGRKPYIIKDEIMISYRVGCSNPNCPIESFVYNTPEMAVAWWNSYKTQSEK